MVETVFFGFRRKVFEVGELVHPKKGTCWWCGAAADSREHRYKRSDLVREFGKPPYRGGQALVLSGTPRRGISGPNSDAFKFAANLCRRCNNERSQPFDEAYDRFMAYLASHRRVIARAREIDLREIFGPAWKAEAVQLIRYYGKHIGCRITDTAHRLNIQLGLDRDLMDFLDGGPYPSGLHLDPCIDSGLQAVDRVLSAGAARTKMPDDGFLSEGPVFTEMSRSTGVHRAPQSCLRSRWFTLYWQLDDRGHTGNPFSYQIVKLRRTDEVLGSRLRLRLNLWALGYRLPWLGNRMVERTLRAPSPQD
jgi:hypothetical protein